jgi:hypothetical protein
VVTDIVTIKGMFICSAICYCENNAEFYMQCFQLL